MTEQVSSFISNTDVIHLSTSHSCWLKSISFLALWSNLRASFTHLCTPFCNECFLPEHISDIILLLKAAQHSDFPLKLMYLNSLCAEFILNHAIIHIQNSQWWMSAWEWNFPSWGVIIDLTLKSCTCTRKKVWGAAEPIVQLILWTLSGLSSTSHQHQSFRLLTWLFC